MKKNVICCFSFRRNWHEIFFIRKLKIFFLLWGVGGLPVEALAQLQHFTIRKDNASVAELVNEIQRTSDFKFFYQKGIFDKASRVSVHVQDVTLQQLLNEVLVKQGFSYEIIDKVVTIRRGQQQKAQQTEISGSVTDTKKQPLPGVTVRIKGTTLGTVTNADGQYRFVVPGMKPMYLIYSFVGMKSREVKYENQKQIDVVLEEETAKLDEVIVVAFGKEKRSSFTGSAAVVDSKELADRQVTNAVDAIAGKVAGVQMVYDNGAPDGTPTLRVRGFSSINAGQDPLVIVDGMPYDGGWNSINPADVASITVLKDAASNALYGARGANGVVMITTKNAGRGEAVVSLDAKWGMNTLAVKDYDYIDDPGEYYAAHFQALYNYYKSEGNSAVYALRTANETLAKPATEGGLGYMVYDVPEGEYLIGENGRLNPNAALGHVIGYKGQDYYLQPDNWKKEAFRDGFRQEYNVNISGGSDKNQFYLSLGYLDNEGVAPASDYSRYSVRLKDNYQVKKWLRVGGNISYTRSNTNYASTGGSASLFTTVSTIAPIYPIFIRDGQGNIRTDENGRMYDYGDGRNAGLNRSVIQNSNPLQTDLLDTDKSCSNVYNLQGFSEFILPAGFRLTFNAGLTDNETRSTTAEQPFYGFGSNNKGFVTVSHGRDFSYNIQQLVNWDRSCGRHNIAVLLGHEYYKHETSSLAGSRTHMFSYFGNQELDGAVVNGSADSNTELYNTEGWFTRLQYNFGEKYFFSGSYRRDASSNFHPEHRWGNFWSLGGAWVMNREEWLQPAWVDMLKFKVSYGSQGNDNIGHHRYVDTYSIKNSNGEVSLTFLQKGKEDITWETNGNFNTGVDFNFFGNRLNGSIDYFRRKTTDMLCYRSAPISMGYDGYYDNVGDMVNKGIELVVEATPIRTGRFSWSVNLNLTHYKNKITYLSEDKCQIEIDGHQGYAEGNYFYGEGLPLHSWYLKKYAGVSEQGQSLWYYTDENGEMKTTALVSEGDYYLCGSPIPDLYGGFGTSFSYAGLDLSLAFTYSVGGKAYDSGYAAAMRPPSSGATGKKFHKDIWKAWSEDHWDSAIPRWQYDDQNVTATSDRWLTDASWLTFQHVNLGYTLPQRWLEKLALQKVRLYLACDNVFYWSKREGFDPRYSFQGTVYTGKYSPMRTFSGGITVQF